MNTVSIILVFYYSILCSGHSSEIRIGPPREAVDHIVGSSATNKSIGRENDLRQTVEYLSSSFELLRIELEGVKNDQNSILKCKQSSEVSLWQNRLTLPISV